MHSCCPLHNPIIPPEIRVYRKINDPTRFSSPNPLSCMEHVGRLYWKHCTVYAEKPDRSYMNVRKKWHKRFEKFIFWSLYIVYISALVFSHCTLTIADFLGPPRPRKPAGFLGMMGLMGFLLAKARILLKVDSDNLSCDLIVLSGTLARHSSPAALLASSLTFFPDPVGTLAILLLPNKRFSS